MIIVVVHWKIHPHEKARADFLKYWHQSLEIKNRSKLVGEYLSEPLSAERAKEAGIPCGAFNIPANPKYDSFFNIGLWENEEAFYAEVIEPFVTKLPETKPFEYEFRERMVLSPLSWRAGGFVLPKSDHFHDAADAV